MDKGKAKHTVTDQKIKAALPNSMDIAPKKEHKMRKDAIADFSQLKDFPQKRI